MVIIHFGGFYFGPNCTNQVPQYLKFADGLSKGLALVHVCS